MVHQQKITVIIDFFLNLGSESQHPYTKTDWESQITSSVHQFVSENGNGYYSEQNSDFTVPSENNLSLLSHSEPSSKMTFRNL